MLLKEDTNDFGIQGDAEGDLAIEACEKSIWSSVNIGTNCAAASKMAESSANKALVHSCAFGLCLITNATSCERRLRHSRNAPFWPVALGSRLSLFDHGIDFCTDEQC